jgi:type IV secretion system protein VirB5
MKHWKWILGSVGLLAAVGVRAEGTGIPVFDLTNWRQQFQQVLAWGKQYGQMASQIVNQGQQIAQMEAVLKGMSGNRNLGTTLSVIGGNSVVPPNVQGVLSTTKTGVDLSNQVRILGASGQVSIAQRFGQIKQLMGAINTTTDQKSFQEMQARIAAENAAIGSDANSIALLNVQHQAEQARIQEEIRLANNANATSTVRTEPQMSGVFVMSH